MRQAHVKKKKFLLSIWAGRRHAAPSDKPHIALFSSAILLRAVLRIFRISSEPDAPDRKNIAEMLNATESLNSDAESLAAHYNHADG